MFAGTILLMGSRGGFSSSLTSINSILELDSFLFFSVAKFAFVITAIKSHTDRVFRCRRLRGGAKRATASWLLPPCLFVTPPSTTRFGYSSCRSALSLEALLCFVLKQIDERDVIIDFLLTLRLRVAPNCSWASVATPTCMECRILPTLPFFLFGLETWSGISEPLLE